MHELINVARLAGSAAISLLKYVKISMKIDLGSEVNIPGETSRPWITEIKASDSDPGLYTRRPECGERGIEVNISGVVRDNAIGSWTDLRKGEVYVGQALHIDVRWRDPVAKAVTGVGSLIVAYCANVG